jgi:hypothetical protein
MDTTIPGTAWETKQYRRDHGERAAMALGLRLAADLIRDDEGPLPPSFTICAPVTGGTMRQRMDIVDGWALRHLVVPEWNHAHQAYEARAVLGPVTYMVYARLAGDADEAPVPAAGEDAPAELAEVA